MEIGKKIKKLRFKAGLTQEQLAEKMGIGFQAISKWENGVTMPDITALPLISEIFGISIDELFDLSKDQRLNRIENRLDTEEELPQDIFVEYEEFLKGQLTNNERRERATDLLAYLYWHRMNSYSKKASYYAKESILADPGKKNCQWILNYTDGHASWDWNMSNHTNAIEFYSNIVKKNSECRLPYLYLIDNLLADHRADDAEKALNKLCKLKDSNPIINQIYLAHIALERFEEEKADGIIVKMISDHKDDSVCLFEAAQYYAKKCNFDKAIELYEESFEKETRRPRFQDELMGIADIYQITGNYKKAAETYGRIVDLLKNEWGLTDDTGLKTAIEKKASLAAKAEQYE